MRVSPRFPSRRLPATRRGSEGHPPASAGCRCAADAADAAARARHDGPTTSPSRAGADRGRHSGDARGGDVGGRGHLARHRVAICAPAPPERSRSPHDGHRRPATGAHAVTSCTGHVARALELGAGPHCPATSTGPRTGHVHRPELGPRATTVAGGPPCRPGARGLRSRAAVAHRPGPCARYGDLANRLLRPPPTMDRLLELRLHVGRDGRDLRLHRLRVRRSTERRLRTSPGRCRWLRNSAIPADRDDVPRRQFPMQLGHPGRGLTPSPWGPSSHEPRPEPRCASASYDDGGGDGATEPYEMLKPSRSVSGTEGIDTTARPCTISPPSLACRLGATPFAVPGSKAVGDE